jgi:hypothetical protein
LVKGGSYIKFKYNTFVSNDLNNVFYGIETANTNEGDGLLVSENCEATYNNLLGKRAGIGCSTEVYVPTAKASIQTWAVDRNKYYGANNKFAYDGDLHELATKSTFWTAAPTNDANSKMVGNINYKISNTRKDI